MDCIGNANASVIMSKKRWFRLFGMDFMASRRVLRMNTPERGAYMQLLILEWDDPNCSLPDDVTELRELVAWNDAWGSFEKVQRCFLRHPDKTLKHRLYNPRLYEEYLYCQSRSQAAKESATVRWQKPATQINNKPIIVSKDRSTKGFSPVVEEVQRVTDKIFPPI